MTGKSYHVASTSPRLGAQNSPPLPLARLISHLLWEQDAARRSQCVCRVCAECAECARSARRDRAGSLYDLAKKYT